MTPPSWQISGICWCYRRLRYFPEGFRKSMGTLEVNNSIVELMVCVKACPCCSRIFPADGNVEHILERSIFMVLGAHFFTAT